MRKRCAERPRRFSAPSIRLTRPLIRYRFPTIKPGAYPEDSGVLRAPHIHFDVLGHTNRLVTQMYFAGESLNDTDRFLATAGRNRERLIVPFSETAADGARRLQGQWDIVLDEG